MILDVLTCSSPCVFRPIVGNFKMNGTIDSLKSICDTLNNAKLTSQTGAHLFPLTLVYFLPTDHLISEPPQSDPPTLQKS